MPSVSQHVFENLKTSPNLRKQMSSTKHFEILKPVLFSITRLNLFTTSDLSELFLLKKQVHLVNLIVLYINKIICFYKYKMFI